MREVFLSKKKETATKNKKKKALYHDGHPILGTTIPQKS
jgi:hypothetical protein